MLVLAVLVVMAAPQQVAVSAAAPQRPTVHAHARSAPRQGPDPEGQRNAPLSCALCLAVADRINATLAEVHERKNGSRGRLTTEELSAALSAACDSGFQGYELWPPPVVEDTENKSSVACNRVILHSRPSPPGNWMERLRKECRWYVQEADEQELYRQWRGMLAFPARRLDLFLCKNSGWLRTCVNLAEEEVPALHPPVVEEPPAAVVVAREARKVATYSITRFRLVCTRILCWRF